MLNFSLESIQWSRQKVLYLQPLYHCLAAKKTFHRGSGTCTSWLQGFWNFGSCLLNFYTILLPGEPLFQNLLGPDSKGILYGGVYLSKFLFFKIKKAFAFGAIFDIGGAQIYPPGQILKIWPLCTFGGYDVHFYISRVKLRVIHHTPSYR